MTTEETAITLTVASGALAALVRPALRHALPGRRVRQREVQAGAVTVASACVVGWYALQPGPMDWRTIVPQVVAAWVLAQGRIPQAASRKKKEDAPMP